MIASYQIFKTLEKSRTTLTKVLTTLGSLGSTSNKFVTPTVTIIARPRQTLLPDDLVAAMADVDTATRDRFHNTFCAATEDIAEGLSTGRAYAADGHWTKWENFCSRVALDPLLIGYKDPVPILNIFARYYRTGDITPTIIPVQSRTAEDAIQSIGQALAALGLANPRYGKDRKIDILPRFQLRCYTK